MHRVDITELMQDPMNEEYPVYAELPVTVLTEGYGAVVQYEGEEYYASWVDEIWTVDAL